MECTPNLQHLFAILMTITIFQVQQSFSALSTCGGTLRGLTGTFTSPNYPHSPKIPPVAAAVGTFSSDDENKDLISCEWKIIAPEGYEIQLNFGEFDMAAGLDECRKGEVEVFAGVGKLKRSMDKYCGSDELDRAPVASNSATVIFRRPEDFSGKGFLVSYIASRPGETVEDFVSCVDRGTDHVGTGAYSVLCPGGCANISDMIVRGSSIYRDDSYLCKAAVHAGVIPDALGGRINVKKLPGDLLYWGSEANGVISDGGAMSETKIQFDRPDAHCKDKINFQQNQLTASSYWIKDENDPKKTKWKPDKALLGEQIDAWSPNNPTIEQWLQVDLKEPKIITAIMTRGSTDKYYTTKSYKIAFSNDSTSPWTFYREDGTSEDKVFLGNHNIFKNTSNNFIRPRIVGRFIRVYPTPVTSENERYSLQIALYGCDRKVQSIPGETRTTTTDSITTTATSMVITQEKIPEHADTTTTKKVSETTTPSKVKSESPEIPEPINEGSIIIIAIVAALAVTSILLAALVLFLVKKRRREPKDPPTSLHPLQSIPDNNNTRLQNKKSRKRSRQAGEHFQNADYKDSLLPSYPPAAGANATVTLPAEQAQFLRNGTGPHGFGQNGAIPMHNNLPSPDETDSFFTDEDDHEYQVIDDAQVAKNRKTPVPSMGKGSSKASTGSSMGNHSRKSDTMQRVWGVDGNQWHNQGAFPSNSPLFPMQGYQMNNGHPHMSSFSSKPAPNGTFFPSGSHLNRNNTFSHEVRYSAGEVPSHPANLRRGNSQSPSRMQRHSSSSNNSSHSYPLNGVHHPHNDPNGPYYSSVPNGEGNPVALNHIMYGGGSIPEQTEILPSASKRAPSYKVPRPFDGDLPALPNKVGNGGNFMQNGSDPSLGYNRNASPPARSDYDRLYRNNSTGAPPDNKNNFSVFNGSHSQYNQLNLNGAKV